MKPAASIRQGRVESGSDSYLNHRHYSFEIPAILLSLAILFSAAFAVVTIPNGSPRGPAASQSKSHAAALTLASLPLAFEENRGQSAEEVRFLSRGRGYALFLTDGETVLSLRGPGSLRTGILKTRLIASNAASRPVGEQPSVARTTYFRGGAGGPIQTSVPNFSRVRYSDVYPGIDLVYYGSERQLEYDFVVEPGADPRAIEWDIDGARAIEITPEGDLKLTLPGGIIRHRKPIVYQLTDQGNRSVEGGYKLLAENRVGFELGPYDLTQPLVIDPVLLYSTYLGASDRDEANGVAVDAQGNIYVAGFTQSTGFPTTGGVVQTSFGGGGKDAFVMKLNPSGSTRLFSTFLGGDSDDVANSIALDAAGNIALCGLTQSSNFPVTPGALQNSFQGGAGDGFVAKLANNGAALIFSTYLGGSQRDACNAVATDPGGNVYAAGVTASIDFPSSTGGGVFQPAFGGGSEDAFIARFDPAGGRIYASFLGGSDADAALAVTANASGRAYVAGYTQSNNFPIPPDVLQSARSGDRDAFLVIMTAPGRLQQTGTYYGGSGLDEAHAVALDASGNVYLAGVTRSQNFPRPLNSIQNAFGGASDGFVVKVNPQVAEILYSTLLGGQGEDNITGMAVDFAGSAIVAGFTTSRNFPRGAETGPQEQFGGGGSDAFFAKIDAPGRVLVQSSYLGGSGSDSARGAAVDSQGNIYLAGLSESGNFPLSPNALQRTRGGPEAFLAKIGLDTVTTVSAASFNPTAVVAPDSIVSAFGRDIVAQRATAQSIPLPLSLGGVSIKIFDSNGVQFAAPMIGVFPTPQPGGNDQINLVIPAGLANGVAQLTVTRNGAEVGTSTVTIEQVAPGIFAALPANLAALNTAVTAPPAAAYTQIYPRGGPPQAIRLTFRLGKLDAFEPAPINVGLQTDQLILVLFGTGIRNATDVSARIGNSPVNVLYAGPAPGFAGLDQVNIHIPFNFFGRGIVELRLTADGRAANVVSLWIE